MTDTTLADRVAELLKPTRVELCNVTACGEPWRELYREPDGDLCWYDEALPAVLALLEAVRRETIEKCLSADTLHVVLASGVYSEERRQGYADAISDVTDDLRELLEWP